MAGSNLNLLHSYPWDRSPLGPMDGWPDEMRGVLAAALHSAFPLCTAWGDDLIQIYNDAYNPIFGAKHPASFGAAVGESWAEIRDFLSPALQQVRTGRRPLWFEGMLLPLARAGAPQECYFDFSYSPIVSRQGQVLGVMSAAVERTAEVVARRRKAAESWVLQYRAPEELAGEVAAALENRIAGNAMDARYCAVHLVDGQGNLLGPPVRECAGRGTGAPRWERVTVPPLRVRRTAAPAGCGHGSYAHIVPVTDPQGRIACAIAMVPDALVPEASHHEFCETLRVCLAAALRDAQARRTELMLLRKDFGQREQLYAFLFEQMEDAAVYTAIVPGGEDEVILAANRRACELSGYGPGELVGMRRRDFFFADDARLREAVQVRERSRAFVGELQLRRKDGTALPVEISARLVELGGGDVRSVCIVRDASWRRAREQALAERARFEAMVELTGGIAHDFNNFLTVIIGSLDALGDLRQTDPEQRELVANAMLGAERAAALTEQLLTFAKRRSLRTVSLRWEPFLGEIRGLLASTLGKAHALQVAVDPQLPPCELDVAHLTSALLNLAANARDAMPGGGVLSLRAQRTVLEVPQEGEDGHALPAGEYVELAVVDTGTGIEAACIRRIFEPFFTTKEPDAGSGLGLAMVQGFVRQSGGDIRVSSSPGQGTRFQLLFPAAGVAGEPVPDAGLSPDGEIVLLVEDDAAVRKQVIAMLRGSGLRVLESHDAESALHQLRTNARVDVLLADVTLPGSASGMDLARLARSRWPKLAILLTTAGVQGPLAAQVRSAGFPVVRKPFTARELVRSILGEMARRSPGGAR